MSESTNEEVRIVGISGSLRKASFNTALLKILADKSASSIKIQVVTLNDIPLYNERDADCVDFRNTAGSLLHDSVWYLHQSPSHSAQAVYP
jgi:NAD(P)H-dependent FMN reductase